MTETVFSHYLWSVCFCFCFCFCLSITRVGGFERIISYLIELPTGRNEARHNPCPWSVLPTSSPLFPLCLFSPEAQKNQIASSQETIWYFAVLVLTPVISLRFWHQVCISGTRGSFKISILSLFEANRGKLDSKKQFSYGWEKQLRV